jgi:hypothetical protein
MKPGAHFEQAAHTPVNLGKTRGGPGDTREKLEKSRLAGAVSPDETDDAALGNIKGDITESPQVITLLTPERGCEYASDHVAECEVALPLPYPVALSKTFYANHWRAHL